MLQTARQTIGRDWNVQILSTDKTYDNLGFRASGFVEFRGCRASGLAKEDRILENRQPMSVRKGAHNCHGSLRCSLPSIFFLGVKVGQILRMGRGEVIQLHVRAYRPSLILELCLEGSQ